MIPPRPPSRRYEYLTDGQEIYRRSFGQIRDEARARLARFPDDVADVAVRVVHAAGDVEVADLVAADPSVVRVARAALADGAPILTDSEMVAHGVTRRRLPADNPVTCLLRDDRVPGLAREWSTTRAAAAVSLWTDLLDGSVVAIGNAPTALFHLLELLLDEGLAVPRPAAIIGIPVGFVGAAESKQALADHVLPDQPAIPWFTVHGRRGGSAMAAAAINAIAHESELA